MRIGVAIPRFVIDPDTLSTAVSHEATHVMKQQNFQPYIAFITHTPDWINFRSGTAQKFLKMITDHIKIDPFTANNQQLFRYYDELNSTVYGLYKSGVLDSNKFNFHEYIPGAFNDFASYIQELEKIHQQFRNRHNAPTETVGTDGGIDALMNLTNEVAGVGSGDLRNTLTSQIDKVSQKPSVRNTGQLYSTVQVANNQAKTVVNQADVAKSLRSKGVYSKDVDGIAEAIVARLNGQERTRLQRSTLSFALNSSAVRDTISEFINRKKTSTEQPSLEQTGFAWEDSRKDQKDADRNYVVAEQIGRSVGAKARNYDVYDPRTGTFIKLAEGTRITQPKNHVMAGKGRDRQIDCLDWLIDKYGGDAVQWTKEKGYGFIEDEYGEIRQVELHWYQEPSVGKVEMKLKCRDGRVYLDGE